MSLECRTTMQVLPRGTSDWVLWIPRSLTDQLLHIGAAAAELWYHYW